MDFELTEEQRMIRDLTRDFAAKEVAPQAHHIDETGDFPMEIVKKMGKLGLMGLQVPPEYGGSGTDAISYAIAVEELAKACASTAVIMSAHSSLCCHGIYLFGTEEQRRKYLPALASGQAIGAFSLTEPQAGSDAGAQRTIAVRDGNEYVLNGHKAWVTNGPVASTILMFAMTDKEKGNRGISAFIVDPKLSGFTIGKVEPKLGVRGSHTSEILLEDYRIPVENRVGEEGEGFRIALTILDGGRIGIAAQALGIAEAAYQESVSYSKERQAFGQPIANFQAIQFMIADMAARIEASRYLILNAAFRKNQHLPYLQESSIAKLYASETAMWVTTKAMQIHGAVGYSLEHPVQRHFRDAKITEIYEGTSEIQRLIISRELLQ